MQKTHRLLLGLSLTAALFPTLAGAAPQKPDPQIAQMVRAVSASRLRTFDSALLVFGTRNTFSERLGDPKRGVVPARDWIRAQFERIALTSGGR
ncbi:MAG: peptidase M28, partial [Candidatus Eremiobacteraeota bacterium]|nr:peptidase M28 [Candidatus Eremiobacteraeota bacterium]